MTKMLCGNSSKTITDSFGTSSPSPAVATCFDALATSANEDRIRSEAWDRLIDEVLIDWGTNPEQFDEEETAPPSGESLAVAGQLAVRMRDCGWPCPTGVIPDGEGGIVFERRQGGDYMRFEIQSNGTVEFASFCDCRLVERIRFPLG